jgi:hypothetical protein
MRLNTVAFAVTCAGVWGGVILLVATGNAVWPNFGRAFLELVASVYPGYQPGPSVGSIAIATAYGLVDGAVGGAVFAWLYNFVSLRFPSRTTRPRDRE